MNNGIKTLVVEDDLEAQDYLSRILETQLPSFEIVGRTDSVSGALDLIKRYKPELIFMDIELKDGSSFEIFDQLDAYDFEVVFITGHQDFIYKAIEHYAFSYILKPYQPDDIVGVVKRYVDLKERLYSQFKIQALSKFISEDDSQFLVQIGFEYISLRVADIVQIVADGNYTNFNMVTGESHLASNGLKYYEELLLPKGFFKASRSVIVNIVHIRSIYKKESISLITGETVSISVRNRSNISLLIEALS